MSGWAEWLILWSLLQLCYCGETELVLFNAAFFFTASVLSKQCGLKIVAFWRLWTIITLCNMVFLVCNSKLLVFLMWCVIFRAGEDSYMINIIFRAGEDSFTIKVSFHRRIFLRVRSVSAVVCQFVTLYIWFLDNGGMWCRRILEKIVYHSICERTNGTLFFSESDLHVFYGWYSFEYRPKYFQNSGF